MKKIKSIHFVGIKGVGMTPLAIIAKEAGMKVSGCDLDEEFITDESLKNAGIKPKTEFSTSHLESVDLIITTGAHGGFEHIEVVEAKKRGMIVWTQGQAAGEFMKGEIFGKSFIGISVSGTHGKTTTTAMIATILKENKLDPSFLIGTGNVPFLNSSGHFGKGKYFVAEADEYATEPKYDKTPKLLWQHPYIAVITNIELDHPDLYANEEEIKNAFLFFTNNILQSGKLVVCIDDTNSRQLANETPANKITYGFSKNAQFYIDKVNIDKEKMFFWVYSGNAILGEFMLNVTGEHNALNALASTIVCLELGLSLQQIKKGLLQFKGSRRRFEFIKNLESGAAVYDDYAHHPTEIKNTLSAFKKTFPNKKIVCIFQPHTYSRTKKLFEQFVYSFSDANELILTDIYASEREEKDNTVSSNLLKNRIYKFFSNVSYFPGLTDVVKYVGSKNYGSEYILVTMGAGDVYKITPELD
ncbi:MAG: UDP-N-acetylmuramate--L-alanine ligase [Candidatus Levybacteria bacterium CG10_big_fil_rev_8_21_14_0_10_35_13]|nr:MAG: UDP-N-acetylmuramate--L-alanine ligase [Candidatus Levybacteria bacterium CG10_big_fil_rev_8_21_14_0_10_35_13]